jgi:H/ACA ribonucleoprotein complex subunit 3
VFSQIVVKSLRQYGRKVEVGGIMVWLLRKCVKCGEYTLKHESCPVCGGDLRVPHPAKFSPEDKYAKYRRAMREVNQK